MTRVDFKLFLTLWVWSIQASPNSIRCFTNSWVLTPNSPNLYRLVSQGFSIQEMSFWVSFWISHSTHLHDFQGKIKCFNDIFFQLSFWGWFYFYWNNMTVSWLIVCFKIKILIQGSQDYAWEWISSQDLV